MGTESKISREVGGREERVWIWLDDEQSAKEQSGLMRFEKYL